MDAGILVTVGIVAAAALGTVVIAVATVLILRKLFGRFPGGAVAEFDATQNEPFELRYTTAEARAYRLCAKIRYHGAGSYGLGNASHTGLECQLRVTVGGEVLADELVSFHGETSPEVDRVITFAYMTSEVRDGAQLTRKGTYVLAEIPPCPAGTEIVVEAEFRNMPGTETSILEVFLGR